MGPHAPFSEHLRDTIYHRTTDDGDAGRIFWEPQLVSLLTNASTRFASAPFSSADVFERSSERVSDFAGKHPDHNLAKRDAALVQMLVEPMCIFDVKSVYGNLHLSAAYRLGCDHPKTVDLAYKCE